MPMTLSEAVDLTDRSIQNIWKKESKVEKTNYYKQYFNFIPGITDLYEKDSSLSGLSQAARITENAVIASETPVQGFDQTYTQVEYGKMLPITKKMWKFGIKKRKLESVVKSLIAACERKREQLCSDRLENGFSTSYSVSDENGNYTETISGGNGVALYSASQTREDGGTNNGNIITDGTTVNMDLDYDALKALHRTASLIKDPKGNEMDIMPDTIIVKKGSANYFRAREILGAVRAAGKGSIPGSANNDSAGIDEFKIIALPYIQTNTSYWFAFDSSMVNDEYGLQLKESQPVELEGPNVVFKTGEIQYKATTMFDLGFNDYRGHFGSKNTNSA